MNTVQGFIIKPAMPTSSHKKNTTLLIRRREPLDPIRPALTFNANRSSMEQETFSRFAATFAPVLGGWTDQRFWLQTVLPAAQLYEPSFNATLALATLYDMPLSDTIRSNSLLVSARTKERYKSAIAWYCKSIRPCAISASQSPSAIALLLTTTILHIMVESRQGHYEATSNLFQTAFAIVHASKAYLRSCRDSTIFHCLARLLNLSIKLPVDSTGIPRRYRDSVITLALKIGAEMNVHEFHILDIELAGIAFGVNDLVEGVTDDESDLQLQLDSWKTSFALFEASPSAKSGPKLALRLTSLTCLYLQASLNLWRGSGFELQEELQLRLLEFGALTMYLPSASQGDNSQHLKTSHALPIYILEAIIAPPCFSIVWYLRNIEVLATTSAIFESFRNVDDRGFIDRLFEYCETLTNTPFDQPTLVEEELFGGRPLCLSVWRMHATIHYLLARGYLSSKLPGDVATEARERSYATYDNATHHAWNSDNQHVVNGPGSSFDDDGMED